MSEPSAKRQKGEKTKETKVVQRNAATMGIMLMTMSAEPFAGAFGHIPMERKIQTRLEQVQVNEMTEDSVFGALPVRVRLLRHRGDDGVVSRGIDVNFMPLEGMKNSLSLVCNFIANWVTNGLANPFQRKTTGKDGVTIWPVKTPLDRQAVDRGPFHAMIFSDKCSLMYRYGATTLTETAAIRWEGSDTSLGNVNAELVTQDLERWREKKKPIYPVLRELLHTLAGHHQDMTTWFAHDMLRIMLGCLSQHLSTHKGERQTISAVFAPIFWMPRELLEAKANGGSSFFLFFRLIQASLAAWLGYTNTNQDTFPNHVSSQTFSFAAGHQPRTDQELNAKIELLKTFILGTVAEGDFKEAYAELEDLLFGYIPPARFEDDLDDIFDGADQTIIPYWKKVCRETLQRHLYDHKKRDYIPGVDMDEKTGKGIGTLVPDDQELAWMRLSMAARILVDLNPALVIHAVIMKEDPRDVSPKSVLKGPRKAELYQFLQARTLYYPGSRQRLDDYATTLPTWMLRGSGRPLTRQLHALHPEVRVQPVETLQLVLSKDRQNPRRLDNDGSGKKRGFVEYAKETGNAEALKNLLSNNYRSDPRNAFGNASIRQLISTFGQYRPFDISKAIFKR